jgi:hypothetical protein
MGLKREEGTATGGCPCSGSSNGGMSAAYSVEHAVYYKYDASGPRPETLGNLPSLGTCRTPRWLCQATRLPDSFAGRQRFGMRAPAELVLAEQSPRVMSAGACSQWGRVAARRSGGRGWLGCASWTSTR